MKVKLYILLFPSRIWQFPFCNFPAITEIDLLLLKPLKNVKWGLNISLLGFILILSSVNIISWGQIFSSIMQFIEYLIDDGFNVQIAWEDFSPFVSTLISNVVIKGIYSDVSLFIILNW